MNVEQVIQQIEGTTCQCGQPKKARAWFCYPCMTLVPLEELLIVSRGNPEDYPRIAEVAKS